MSERIILYWNGRPDEAARISPTGGFVNENVLDFPPSNGVWLFEERYLAVAAPNAVIPSDQAILRVSLETSEAEQEKYALRSNGMAAGGLVIPAEVLNVMRKDVAALSETELHSMFTENYSEWCEQIERDSALLRYLEGLSG